MRHQTREAQEVREAKLDALHTKLTESVGALVSGEDWRRALEFAARFRSRSFNNTMLIYIQHNEAFQLGRVPAPIPTYVAGFKQWQTLGRQVMKGQSGYGILAPVTARFASRTPRNNDSWRRLGRGERPQPGEATRTKMIGLRPAYVWDVSQTDGEPLPEQPAPTPLSGRAPAGFWDGLAAQVEAHGFTLQQVSNAGSIGGANGLTDFTTRQVSVRIDMDDAARVKTLAHELGHVMLHSPDARGATYDAAVDAALHRGIAEVEAESVALMIGAAHGLDTTSYTVPYVSSWASSVPGTDPVEVVQATAERVRTTSLRMLDKLDTAQVGDGDPPGLVRETSQRQAPARQAPTRGTDTPAVRPADEQTQQVVGL
ncbi:serine/arginine repetitive matrix protein 2 [Aeromicrobium sp. A1-2]|uniref:ArdC family protein n=1 Tax=Aeromicrobium sp. A1-2 TaxID=2107713 RepID=UPI000E53DE00|nr:ArdC family protein [Aeromicrobium sp. A1-2]AXT85094.1 serine/arginine repetitive matrix protein 2 [Aeromicrobium sp. A1-2]